MENHDSLETLVVVNCVFNAPLILISITGNALVLAAIIRTPSIRSTSVIMLCSLAVSDLLVGFVAQPFFIANELTASRYIASISEIMAFVLCGASLCTMTAISVERFIALRYPMKYQAAVTTKWRVIYVSIIIIWVCNILFAVFYFWQWTTYFSVMAVGICLGFFISTFSYIKIYIVVRRHQAQIQTQQQAAQQNSTCAGNNFNMGAVRMKRSAVNTFTFYVAMILCYFPIIISLSLSSISYENWSKVWHLADTVAFLNSSINPILYCWRLRELRTAVYKTLKDILCTQTAQG
ncbi:melanocortin receptor 5-like [Orbicella faveolata]|uniref:melanocortin receptor 5-like n=1 Tax=Orbicella faveolata TaxID=48498 RepID=UPI0009E37B1B|nr:melanocortin receptor 5-like [Orbicella faveolata]